MNSTLSTVCMLGIGGGNTGFLFITLGFATSSVEPVIGVSGAGRGLGRRMRRGFHRRP